MHDVRQTARDKGQDPNTADVPQQIKDCKEVFTSTYSRKPLMPVAVWALTIYISLVKQHKVESEKANAQKSFERGKKSLQNCRGDAFADELRRKL